jgi:lysophospholipase L1-like esterase
MPHKTPLAGLVAMLLLALALPAAANAKSAPKQFYVSLGDSYAVGWQHPALYDQGPTLTGFDRQIPKLAKKKHYRLTEVNFGCGGATTTSILEQKGCVKAARAIGGRNYKTTQAVAAERFLRSHRGKVALVTVSIGGNDVTACARDTNPVPCVAAATASVTKNVTKLAKALRKAGGKKVRIVGTTYPDVILGQWVRQPANQTLASLSTTAFKSLINPALVKAYKAGKGKLVDVTRATGAYTPLTQLTTLAPYGSIPVAVTKVCQLTWYCQFGDIHANSKGYKIIAQLVVKTLPKRKK